MFRLSNKIKQCHVQLLKWSSSQVRITPRLIASKKAQLRELESQPNGTYDGGAVNAL